jgi:hypothetical protein
LIACRAIKMCARVVAVFNTSGDQATDYGRSTRLSPVLRGDDERHFYFLPAVDDRLVPVGRGDALRHPCLVERSDGILFCPPYWPHASCPLAEMDPCDRGRDQLFGRQQENMATTVSMSLLGFSRMPSLKQAGPRHWRRGPWRTDLSCGLPFSLHPVDDPRGNLS